MKRVPATSSLLLQNLELKLFGIEMVFEGFRNYQTLMESFLEVEKSNLENSYNEEEIAKEAKQAGEYEEQLYMHIVSGYVERFEEISMLYPHNFRASFLIQIFSFIEYELKMICKYHHQLNKTDYSIKDLKGNSDIEKAKTYLVKSCKIDFNNLEPEWSFINQIRMIRNKLIHHQGEVIVGDVDRKPILSFLKKNDFIETKEPFEEGDIDKKKFTILIKNRKLNEALLEKSKSFFKKLLIHELDLVKGH